MPKPSEYTPLRRRIMQATMWVILGATIALAALVGSAARKANRIDLAPTPVVLNDLTVRLPLNWRTVPRGDDPRVVAQAVDRSGSGGGRSVRVLLDRVDAPISPLQYVIDRFGVGLGDMTELDETDNGAAPRDASEAVSLPIAGRHGILVLGRRGDPLTGRLEKHVVGCAVLPSGRVVIVHLQGNGGFDPSDAEVVKQVAEAITIAREPEVGGSALSLPNGVQLTAPPEFAAVAEPDSNITERLLWPTRAAGATADEFERTWTTAELVGCLASLPAGEDAKQRSASATSALHTLLLVRDPIWRIAKIEPIAAETWRAEAKRSSGFVETAYLRTDASGQALLAIFHGGYGASDPAAIWEQIAPTVKFTGASELESLQDIGAAEANRLRRTTFDKVLADRDDQWWLWTGPGERPHIGWSHLEFEPAGLAGKQEIVLRRLDGVVRRTTNGFNYRDAGNQYRSEVKLSPPAEASQTTSLKGDQLSVAYRGAEGAAMQLKVAPPPQYVPGALAPLVLGQLEPRAMILRTESFLTSEAIGPSELLTVIIRPVSQTQRTADGESKPMRCLTAEVNGSGQVSRWYFRQSGDLEYVDLPHGVQRVLSDENALQVDFGSDPKMSRKPDN